jgi:secondary thiamine-phosphate synthase enzyme
MQLRISSNQAREIIDITDELSQQLPTGTCLLNILVKHTTCAITAMDIDPGMDENLLDAVTALIPKKQWQHPHNSAHEHVTAHLLGSILGPSLTVPFHIGQLQLGTWQRIILIELDGPRERRLLLSTTPNDL